jgi:hypothetical protein
MHYRRLRLYGDPERRPGTALDVSLRPLLFVHSSYSAGQLCLDDLIRR